MSLRSALENPGRIDRILKTKTGDLFCFDVSKVEEDAVTISDSKGNLKLDQRTSGMTMNPTNGVTIAINDISWVSESKEYVKPIQHGGNMATVEMIEALKAQADALVPAIAEEKKVERDAGFDEGVKSVASAGDKIFSLEEMNAEIQPRDAKIAELQAVVDADVVVIDGLKAQLAMATDGAAAVAAFKAELMAKYTEQQVAETAGETGFAALLA